MTTSNQELCADLSDGRKKVLFVSGTLAGGGAERVTSTLLHHLDRDRFQPSLCLIRRRIDYTLPSDVSVASIHAGDQFDVPLASLAKRRPWILFQTIQRLRSVVRASMPDVIISNIDQVNCATGLALSLMSRRPKWIARMGSNPLWESNAVAWFRKRTYPKADRIVVNSRRLAKAFAEDNLNLKSRIAWIANPTDFGRICALSKEPPSLQRIPGRSLLVTAGRLSSPKRFDILIDAVSRIQGTIPIELWICGEGPLRSQLEEQIRKQGLGDVVRLLGFCHNPYSLIVQGDVFVMTSDHEGLPNALIEAQGLGIPAVATDCDYGPNEIIENGLTGVLVPPGDSQAIADAITSILQDSSRRDEMGRCAKLKTRSRFDVESLLTSWQTLIGSLVDVRGVAS